MMYLNTDDKTVRGDSRFSNLLNTNTIWNDASLATGLQRPLHTLFDVTWPTLSQHLHRRLPSRLERKKNHKQSSGNE